MHEHIARLRANITKVFLGSTGESSWEGDAGLGVVDRVIACLLARGHILIEDVPGVGKTILATALARSVDCTFHRIQLTPDLLPSDVLGVNVYNRETGEFEFKPGPIFANIILADEINRTTPRTQAAMLEAMNEGTVTIDARMRRLEKPFMVVATQNPYEFEGTYLLPESQLDRFLMRTRIGYPDPGVEMRVLEERPGQMVELEPVMTRTEVIDLQDAVDRVRVDPSLLEYIVRFAGATRVQPELLVGLSPRGSLALAQAARASALLDGRDYAVPEDVTRNIEPVCAHRVVMRSHSESGAGNILRTVVDSIRSPV